MDASARARAAELMEQGMSISATLARLKAEGLVDATTSRATVHRATRHPMESEEHAHDEHATTRKEDEKPPTGTLDHLRFLARQTGEAVEVAFQARALRTYSALLKIYQDQIRAVVALEPPPQPNPDLDPANRERLLEALGVVRARVEAEERKA